MIEMLGNIEVIVLAVGGLLAVAGAVAAETKSTKDDEYVSKARRYWRSFLRVIRVLGYEGKTYKGGKRS